jgi:uncharacterized protein (TIGR04141 family)
LTVYAIRSTIDGSDVTAFTDIINDAALKDPKLESYDLTQDFGFEAQLFTTSSKASPPKWASFFEAAFPDVVFPSSAAARAVLAVRIRYYGKVHYFAFTFGTGRFLLKPNSYEPNFGLRTALNAIYEGDDVNAGGAPERIRQIGMKTVAANTLHTSTQANRFATFETFGVDIRSDLLSGITGTPADKNKWGTRLTGRDALGIAAIDDLSGLGTLCKQLHRTWRGKDYLQRFSWIDNVKIVRDPELVAKLHKETLSVLAAGGGNLDLAPPELINWDEIATFHYSGSREEYTDLRLSDYLAARDPDNPLDLGMLTRHRVTANDGNGEEINAWPIFRCLDGEIRVDNKTYLLVNGDYYVVAPPYKRVLDAFIAALPEADVALPDSQKTGDQEQTEGDYNKVAADSSPDFFLLDKETVRVDTHTSPIEVCDVLTKQRQFIHVKRKLQSSALSHLFGQGAVSGELFVGNHEFRKATRKKISDSAFKALIPESTPPANNYEVVYAIIAKWKNRPAAEALPFFSKINLRNHAEELQRMGFTVSIKRIDVV